MLSCLLHCFKHLNCLCVSVKRHECVLVESKWIMSTTEERDETLYTLNDFFLTRNILPPMPALEQDDKGVQVDLQDLGYETSGKSENDREESSSTGRLLSGH